MNFPFLALAATVPSDSLVTSFAYLFRQFAAVWEEVEEEEEEDLCLTLFTRLQGGSGK